MEEQPKFEQPSVGIDKLAKERNWNPDQKQYVEDIFDRLKEIREKHDGKGWLEIENVDDLKEAKQLIIKLTRIFEKTAEVYEIENLDTLLNVIESIDLDIKNKVKALAEISQILYNIKDEKYLQLFEKIENLIDDQDNPSTKAELLEVFAGSLANIGDQESLNNTVADFNQLYQEISQENLGYYLLKKIQIILHQIDLEKDLQKKKQILEKAWNLQNEIPKDARISFSQAKKKIIRKNLQVDYNDILKKKAQKDLFFFIEPDDNLELVKKLLQDNKIEEAEEQNGENPTNFENAVGKLEIIKAKYELGSSNFDQEIKHMFEHIDNYFNEEDEADYKLNLSTKILLYLVKELPKKIVSVDVLVDVLNKINQSIETEVEPIEKLVIRSKILSVMHYLKENYEVTDYDVTKEMSSFIDEINNQEYTSVNNELWVRLKALKQMIDIGMINKNMLDKIYEKINELDYSYGYNSVLVAYELFYQAKDSRYLEILKLIFSRDIEITKFEATVSYAKKHINKLF